LGTDFKWKTGHTNKWGDTHFSGGPLFLRLTLAASIDAPRFRRLVNSSTESSSTLTFIELLQKANINRPRPKWGLLIRLGQIVLFHIGRRIFGVDEYSLYVVGRRTFGRRVYGSTKSIDRPRRFFKAILNQPVEKNSFHFFVINRWHGGDANKNFGGKNCFGNKVSSNQGDKIGRVFARWAMIYFEPFR
jgi:hypothetical protein